MALGITEEDSIMMKAKRNRVHSSSPPSSIDDKIKSCPRKKRSVRLEVKKSIAFDRLKELEQRMSLLVNEGTCFQDSCLVKEKGSDQYEKEGLHKAESFVFTEDEVMAAETLLMLADHAREICSRKEKNLIYRNNEGNAKKRKKVVDEHDDDSVPEKKRKITMNRNNGGNLQKRKRVLADGEDDVDDGPDPPPGMPEAFKNRISELVGADREISTEKLVVQKRLETSDVCGVQNRFSIPMGKLREEYLEEHEKGVKTQLVHIIDPSLRHYQINLKYWLMNIPLHVLNGPSWRVIRETNGLCRLMIMQLWAVRVDNELWFALVNITPPTQRIGMQEEAMGSDHAESSSAGAARIKGSSE